MLLDFGANWCGWCRRLHTLFTTDPRVRDTLKRNYITVMVDVNTRNGPARNAAVEDYTVMAIERWPGGLTLVCHQQPSVHWDLGDTGGTVAVRMPLLLSQ